MDLSHLTAPRITGVELVIYIETTHLNIHKQQMWPRLRPRPPLMRLLGRQPSLLAGATFAVWLVLVVSAAASF
jgi:hypothetical protein